MSLLFPEIVLRDLEKGEISFNPVFGIWSKSSNLYKSCFQRKLPMESTQQMFAQGKKERGGREEGNPNSHKSFIRKVTYQRGFHKSFCHHMLINRDSQVALVVKNLPAKAAGVRDTGLISGLGRSPGEGHGNPLKYSYLENPMDRGYSP